MGACLCKDGDEDPRDVIGDGDVADIVPVAVGDAQRRQSLRSACVDDLVLATLDAIRTLVNSDQEPPASMMKLHALAEREAGWLSIVHSIVEVIPMRDPLGPATIALLLDDCPLPSKETIQAVKGVLHLNRGDPDDQNDPDLDSPDRQRNVCLVLACLAEKLAGTRSVELFSADVMQFLVGNMDDCIHPAVILFSLIALERFAQTRENQLEIRRRLESEHRHPLVDLEDWLGKSVKSTALHEESHNEDRWLERQVWFCAQWCLDNLYVVEGRPFSYTKEDFSRINVMLNSNDVSEYLKIGPDGLEARCDAASFESVRCTFQVSKGVWYYEVTIITEGIMQIGWATKDSKFLNHDGFGIGDDEYSVAFDGCRQLVWHNAISHGRPHLPRWKAGDVVGALVDFDARQVIFTLNGTRLQPFTEIFERLGAMSPTANGMCDGGARNAQPGFFAAASFMSFQQCRFNFGADPFRFPPADREFQAFNDVATMSAEEKVILPRSVKLDLLKRVVVGDDACSLCFDARASSRLEPCGHEGFCAKCAGHLDTCPLCRNRIDSVVAMTTVQAKVEQ